MGTRADKIDKGIPIIDYPVERKINIREKKWTVRKLIKNVLKAGNAIFIFLLLQNAKY